MNGWPTYDYVGECNFVSLNEGRGKHSMILQGWTRSVRVWRYRRRIQNALFTLQLDPLRKHKCKSDRTRLLPQGAQPLADLVSQRTRANLELQEFVLCACAAFYVPGHIPAIGRPDPTTLPTGIGTVNPSIHSSGEETHRIRHA
jgi:hypothetical protein